MIESLIGPITGLLDKFIVDKDQKAKLAHDLATMAERHAQEIAKGQIEVNKQEAANRSPFVAGWRPGIGWVCVAALAYQFVLAPLGVWLAAIGGYDLPTPPSLDDMLWELMFGLLGMAGLRSVEKLKGVTR